MSGGSVLPRPITIKIRRVAGGEDIPLPALATAHAAGADLRAAVVDGVEREGAWLI